MSAALRLARRGRGRVEPNPMVGAVLVRDRSIIAEGYHHHHGGSHGEIEALQRCARQGLSPNGCDMFITLEPCNHHGKTPPCTEALIKAGIARVFVAMADPNPQVAGRGIERLRQAGIEVDVGLCENEARLLNEAYIKHITTGLPWVMVKWAQTLDGRIATQRGDSKWISNERSRNWVHRLRAHVDAIVVGIGTVLADDPQLTARNVALRRSALRVVVDPHLKIPLSAKLLTSTENDRVSPRVMIGVGEKIHAARPKKIPDLQARGVEFIALPDDKADASKLSLRPLLEYLVTTHQATNVLVEGGSKLNGSIIQQGLADQVIAFVSPKVLGDAQAIPAVRGMRCDEISTSTRLSLHRVRRVGKDVMLDYRIL